MCYHQYLTVRWAVYFKSTIICFSTVIIVTVQRKVKKRLGKKPGIPKQMHKHLLVCTQVERWSSKTSDIVLSVMLQQRSSVQSSHIIPDPYYTVGAINQMKLSWNE